MAVADELCDRVAFLVDGRIALIDAPRALKLRYGERRVRVEVRPEGPGATGGTASAAAGEDAGPSERFEFPLAGLGDDAEFLALLRGGRVETLHTLEATLEEIFIRVTGRELG